MDKCLVYQMKGSPLSTLNFKKVRFMLIKNKKNIKGVKMFENTFLYTAYAGDSTFFLKDKNSIKELLNTVNYFYLLRV